MGTKPIWIVVSFLNEIYLTVFADAFCVKNGFVLCILLLFLVGFVENL